MKWYFDVIFMICVKKMALLNKVQFCKSPIFFKKDESVLYAVKDLELTYSNKLIFFCNPHVASWFGKCFLVSFDINGNHHYYILPKLF